MRNHLKPPVLLQSEQTAQPRVQTSDVIAGVIALLLALALAAWVTFLPVVGLLRLIMPR